MNRQFQGLASAEYSKLLAATMNESFRIDIIRKSSLPLSILSTYISSIINNVKLCLFRNHVRTCRCRLRSLNLSEPDVTLYDIMK